MKRTFFLLLLVCIGIGCIEQIEFDPAEFDELVVVDGVFTNVLETQTIKLSSTVEVNSQVRIPHTGALINIESAAGEVIKLTETSEGDYTATAQAIAGQKYRLAGQLGDGRLIETAYQSVPDTITIQSISTMDTMLRFVNESGAFQRQNTMQFFATNTAASVPQDLYLRFSKKTVYQIKETQCGPFHTPKTCYFYDDRRPVGVSLLKVPATDSPVTFSTLVHQRGIDETMTEVFALDLYLYSYNKSSYEYWEQFKQIFDQTGDISDVAPARLIGNVTTQDGSEVLGQFSVVGKTRKVKTVGNADFRQTILPYCGFLGNPPWPVPTDCCNCLLSEGATLDKPDYWP